MDAAVSALLGALIGAGAGVLGQALAATYAHRAERRRLAVESGFREWEQLVEVAANKKGGAEVFPPALFVHFNYELLRLIDSSGGLTQEATDGSSRAGMLFGMSFERNRIGAVRKISATCTAKRTADRIAL